MIELVFFVALLSQSTSFVIKAGCAIQIPNLQPEPIVVDLNYQYIYAEPDSTEIALNVNENILISCPGGTLSVNGRSYLTVEATCVSGSDFQIDSDVADFNSITCSRNPFHTARYTGRTCEQNGQEIEIGFILDDTDDTQFVRQIVICFDEVLQNSLYSTYDLTRSIVHHESGVARPNFIQDDFYNVGGSVNYLYERENQRATINALIGLSTTSTKYVQNGNDFYLARGHLTAKAAFVYAPQQVATFHYVNVAPQWQTFNGGNWNQAEMDTRAYAQANELDLKVYTGTYGVTTLPHEDTGEDIQLYLYVDGDIRGLPVPQLYWKVVYEPVAKKGVALIGVNNPYREDFSEDIICEDVSDQISWLNWDPQDTTGYCYACAVDDLRNTVPYLPALTVNGLLV